MYVCICAFYMYIYIHILKVVAILIEPDLVTSLSTNTHQLPLLQCCLADNVSVRPTITSVLEGCSGQHTLHVNTAHVASQTIILFHIIGEEYHMFSAWLMCDSCFPPVM